MKLSILSLVISVFVLIIANSCDPAISEKLLPVLTTNEMTLITQNTAESGGIISSDNGFKITARGVCWSLKPNPTINDSLTKDSTGTGAYTSYLKNLIADTTYYVRAYATNKDGTAYGLQITVKTLPAVFPILCTTAVTNITISSATSGGNITFDGGSRVTVRGVCWSTKTSPTIADNKTIVGSGTSSFICNLSGLTDGTTYYVRAFSTNDVGTSYGNQESFITQYNTVTDIDGNVYRIVSIGTQTWMIENLKTTKYKDGTAIPLVTDSKAWTALVTPGYCWYNNDAATNKSTYGALYNWYAVNTSKLAPAGWHVATQTEWTRLYSYVSANRGTSTEAKALAATTNWASSTNPGAIGNDLTTNNSTGFTALPGGCRSDFGTFYGIGEMGYWYSSTEFDATNVWYRSLSYNNYYMYQIYNSKRYGISVRCVKD